MRRGRKLSASSVRVTDPSGSPVLSSLVATVSVALVAPALIVTRRGPACPAAAKSPLSITVTSTASAAEPAEFEDYGSSEQVFTSHRQPAQPNPPSPGSP